jgi:hypothetical protein
VSVWLVASFSRCSGSAVRGPHVHSISIRYSSLICNTLAYRVTWHTTLPMCSALHAHTLGVYASPPLQNSAVHPWRTRWSVGLLDKCTNTQHHQQSVLSTTTAVPDFQNDSSLIVQKRLNRKCLVYRAFRRHDPCFQETKDRAFGERKVVLSGDVELLFERYEVVLSGDTIRAFRRHDPCFQET